MGLSWGGGNVWGVQSGGLRGGWGLQAWGMHAPAWEGWGMVWCTLWLKSERMLCFGVGLRLMAHVGLPSVDKSWGGWVGKPWVRPSH